MRTTFIHDVALIPFLANADTKNLSDTACRFGFLSNDYYLSLIDQNDHNDPLRRLIVPSPQETELWGIEDASNEKNYTVLPGIQHKYPSTVLLLVSDQCAGLCRYCFRKRIFSTSRHETLKDLPSAVEYIRSHTEITNVLLTGGDSLMLPKPQLVRRLQRSHRRLSHRPVYRPYGPE